MNPRKMHFSKVQYSTVQYSAVQYSTVQYSAVQYSTVQYSTSIHGRLLKVFNLCVLYCKEWLTKYLRNSVMTKL